MIGVSGWMFLLVPAYPGSPGQRAVKQLRVCVSHRRPSWLCSAVMHRTFSQFLLITETNLCVVVHSCLHTRQQHLNSLQFHLQDDRKLFSALTPLAGRQECTRPAKIRWRVVGVVIWLERGADCLHMVQLMSLHPQTPSSLASFKSRLVLPSWYWPTQVVVENKPLNGCSISNIILYDRHSSDLCQ